MTRHTGSRNCMTWRSRLRDSATAPLGDQRGSALATILVLIVVLTVIGAAMVNSTLTEISIAYTQGDSSAAQYAAEAGLSRAMYELSQNAGWTGTTGTIGDGQYVVTVTSSGSVRAITSTGTHGGGRRVLKAAVNAIPQSAGATVLANTTATIGSAATGLTVRNDFPSSAASAVHANNKLTAATAMTVNTAGANIIGGLTANGTISGVTCASWAWTCNASAAVRVMPELNMDGTTPTCDGSTSSSYRCRAKNTTDPTDGKNLYFRGGDSTSRCNSGGAWVFTTTETQRCWDYYVSQRAGTIGQNIPNAVFFVEFNSGEATTYTTTGGGGSIAFRAAKNGSWNTLGSSNGVGVPAGVVDGDVMLAAISWSDGSSETITTPAEYALNTMDSTLPAGADFTKEFGDYTGDISLPVSVAPAPASEESFGYTKAGVPGAAGVTGDYWLSAYVTPTANANIWLSVALARVNSSGTEQYRSTFTAEKQLSSVTQYTFSFTALNLGVWSSGDRLKVVYKFRNAASSTQSVTIGTPVANVGSYNMVRTPWTSGWTLVRRIDNGSNVGLAIYWKVASNEAYRVCAGYYYACYTWKFSPGSGSQSATGAIVAYSGVDTATPINVENGQTTARSTSHSTPSITTTVANAMVVASFAVGAATATTNQWTPPAGMTERSDSGAQAVALGVDEQLQATVGATGVKTATAAKSAVGATHILALKPGGGAVTVNCPGYVSAVETLCIRATPASPYANSVLSQVTGAIVNFRRGSGTTVVGDIALENIAQASANYTHSSITGDPALVAGGKVILYSSGFTAGRTNTGITGMVYTFAGVDNPSGDLQGAGTGTVYTLRSTNSDLTGGADFNKELYPGAETAGTIAVSVAASATEDSFGYTKAGEPGLSGATGNYTVETNVTVANANIQLSAAVARVNSSGVEQVRSSFTAEQSAGTTGVKTFALNSIDLGTWASGDRLKVLYRFKNTVASVQSVTISTGTTSTEATAPWTVGVDVQHGADTIALTFSGILVSNGSISLQDTLDNVGKLTVRYDSVVANNLPAAFTASTTDYILIPISWSSGD